MKTTMDANGRVLIPGEIRRRAALSRGSQLEATWEDGKIVLQPRPIELRVVKRGRFFVGEHTARVPKMPASVVDGELDDLRRGR